MKHLKFGEKNQEETKELQLIRIAENYGEGAVFYTYRYPPRGLIDFIREQYQRFRIPLTPQINEHLPVIGAALALDLFDYYDPYMLFWDFSDVVFTDDWNRYAYEVELGDGTIVECEPELLETYKLIPNQSEAFFNNYMSMPGIDSLPPEMRPFAGDAVRDYEEGYHYPYGLHYDHSIPSHEEIVHYLEDACINEDGEINTKKMWAYWDISLWAGIMWTIGPLSRQFRIEYNEITEQCFIHGECIIYDGVVVNPKRYRRAERQSNSCYKCGISAWCTEITMDSDGIARLICEGCLSKGMPRLPGTSCGTKFCKYWECPHNANYMDKNAMRGDMRQHGQLAKKRDANLGLVGGEPRKLSLLG